MRRFLAAFGLGGYIFFVSFYNGVFSLRVFCFVDDGRVGRR